MVHQFEIYYHERNLQKFDLKIDREKLIEALLVNLEELFARIEAHHLPYAELYNELFSWYTFTRMHLAKHLLVAGSKFHAYSPAMSLQMLTLTSRIHPNQRLNYRFAKQLFRMNKDLKRLSTVPTAQAPLVPQNFPDLLKFAMWGIRSTADQFLIRRMMKSKNFHGLVSVISVYQLGSRLSASKNGTAHKSLF
ncbi:glycosyltransferase family 49 protein [Antarcticibacterium sp. 1MA-6-2]|uniref:glycosyltransferase family 49 protein n=1 Tax=Antarcticibacterium sp. 1MA-6-2 TaxID=2908210 RepID=UPI001F1F43FA|nr:glycosyltransferase family 49 protein [Antarcticibacterium sp. 1MA-6-2]UJH92499.1 glycosyltransferase family 49 protein [Antarcticibacterium sp. 1MA-6-2]